MKEYSTIRDLKNFLKCNCKPPTYLFISDTLYRYSWLILEELSHLFPAEEFEEKICEYLYKKTVNHKEELSIDRIFVQGRYVMK